ncbi:hypothetical protein [Embleya scabrispora]|uniref:hypothetical protein n=1 Tax=Embleya scabrispora TaxID=159449 RepID=UPI00117CDA45|nr:hypothetical protein [Embleya scabrispora]
MEWDDGGEGGCFGTRTVRDHPHVARGEPGGASDGLRRYAESVRIGNGGPQHIPGGATAAAVGTLPAQ